LFSHSDILISSVVPSQGTAILRKLRKHTSSRRLILIR
jgi:pantothenate kinase type III